MQCSTSNHSVTTFRGTHCEARVFSEENLAIHDLEEHIEKLGFWVGRI